VDGQYVAIGFALSSILLFPMYLIGALAAFLLLNFIRKRSMLKRSGINMKGLLRSLHHRHRHLLLLAFKDREYNLPKYYCMSRGKENKETACSNCGSKMKRVE
jgi:hypothetical protein